IRCASVICYGGEHNSTHLEQRFLPKKREVLRDDESPSGISPCGLLAASAPRSRRGPGLHQRMQPKVNKDKRKGRFDPNRWGTREDGAMLYELWSWLRDPANREVITWIGGGLVV